MAPSALGSLAVGAVLLLGLGGDAWGSSLRLCGTTARRHRTVRVPSWRPSSAFGVGSSRGFPFRVLGPAGTDALAASIRDAVDEAWQAEIINGGWAAPPPDNGGPDSSYDIYIDPLNAQGEAYTQPEDDAGAVGRYALTSYIGLPDSYADAAELFSIAAHELNHASQFAIDAAEDDAFFESSSVFAEWYFAHDVPTYATGVDDYQAHPQRALNYLGSDLYEYGAGIWLIFLSERHDAKGQQLVQRLWEGSKQASSSLNEPDFLDVLGTETGERGLDMGQFFATFATWRYFTGSRDDGQHFSDGAAWGNGSRVAAGQLTAAPEVSFQETVAAFGAGWRVVSVPAGTEALDVAVTGAGGVAAVVPLDPGGAAVAEPTVISTSAPGRAVLAQGAQSALVAVTYAPAGWDPDSKDWTAHTVQVSLAAVGQGADAGLVDAGIADAGAASADAGPTDAGAGSPQPPDAGADADTPGGAGLGCHCAEAGGGSWAVLALGLVALVRPRRPTSRHRGQLDESA